MNRETKKLDVVICLGKSLNEDGSLGIILEERVKLAYKTAKKQKVPLILSGGQSHKLTGKQKLSEAKGMCLYLKNKYNDNGLKIILEEKGGNTNQQLCIIKNEFLLPNKWYNVGLVTDSVHLKRAEFAASWILGRKFFIYGYGSLLKISNKKIDEYKGRESRKYQYQKGNFSKNFKRGDDNSIFNYDKVYRKTVKKHTIKGGNPNDTIKIPGYTK